MKRALLGLLLIVALAVGGWWIYERLYRDRGVPAQVLAAESALSRPDLVALVSADLESLAHLGPDPEGAPDAAGHPLVGFVLDLVGLPSADLRPGVTHAVTAFYAEGDEPWGASSVLFGRFEPDALESRLRARPEFLVDEGIVLGERVLRLRDRDAEVCEESRDWAIQLGSERIVVSRGRSVKILLERLATPGREARDLARFRELRGGMLLRLALFMPERMPAGIEHPVVRASTQTAREELAAFSALYAGVRLGTLPPALLLAVELETRDASAAPARVASWLAPGEALKREWQRIAPHAAALRDALRVKSEGQSMRLEAKLEPDWLPTLAAVPAELMLLASRGLEAAGTSAAAGRDVDELDPWPLDFRSSYAPSNLPEYDPEVALAGPVDLATGPFGIRVLSVAALEAKGGGLEIELQALARTLVNLGEPPDVRFHLTSVQAQDGGELLRQEDCGRNRNDRPAPFGREYGGELMRATKTVRLHPDARLAAAQLLAGHVELDFPVRTESVVLEQPQPGDSASRQGATLQITGITPTSFSYRVSGDVDDLLHVRALNSRGQPLASRSAWTAGMLFGDGRLGVREHAGTLASVEAVFALERRPLRYAFELASARPGTDAEELASESPQFIDYTQEQFLEEFGPMIGRAFEPDHAPRALSTAGPFTVALENLATSSGLDPRFTVLAPDIPNLSYNLSALELALERVHLRDGSVASSSPGVGKDAKWHALLSPHRSWGKDELRDSVTLRTGLQREAAEVSRLDGRLVFRLPRAVETVHLPELEPGSSVGGSGAEFTLDELGRDRFVLLMRGSPEKLFAVQAFNDQGHELLVDGAALVPIPSGTRMSFGVHGRPARIDIQLASAAKRFSYAFRLKLPDPAPAAPEP